MKAYARRRVLLVPIGRSIDHGRSICRWDRSGHSRTKSNRNSAGSGARVVPLSDMLMEERSMISRIVRPLIGKQCTLGHDMIDGDIRAIADGWFCAVNCEQIQFPFRIARLKKLMRVHFAHEAALMHSAGGVLCGCHRQEHQTLLDVCDQAATLGTNNWQRTQSLLRNRYPKLMRDHIACMDQIAVIFININTDQLQ